MLKVCKIIDVSKMENFSGIEWIKQNKKNSKIIQKLLIL